MSEESRGLPLQAEIEQVLRDLRGVIDEALVQVNLGEKSAKELLSPIIDRVAKGIAELRSRF